MQEAVDIIRSGGCLIYPTETLYALGAGAYHADAARRIIEIKARPASKPLPLIIGGREQLILVTGWISKTFDRLTAKFWPGPLSVIVPALKGLPDEVKDENGFTSVRWTAHPVAQELCLKAETPLIATSANRSGQPAAATPDELDQELVREVGNAYLEKPWPGGGLPSTVVRCAGTDRLQVLREGAISTQMLEGAGFTVG